MVKYLFKRLFIILLGSLIISGCGISVSTRYNIILEKKKFLEKNNPVIYHKAEKKGKIEVLLFEPKEPVAIEVPVDKENISTAIYGIEKESNTGIKRLLIKNYDFFYDGKNVTFVFYLPFIYFIDGVYKPTITIYFLSEEGELITFTQQFTFYWRPMKKSKYPYSFKYLPPLGEIENMDIVDDKVIDELKKELKNINFTHFSFDYRKKIETLKKRL
jgi:hypothetical protein